MMHRYRSAITLALVIAFPDIALWLPRTYLN